MSLYLKELKPRKALNKAFLKVKPNRNEIEGFKSNLIKLIDTINETESEEFHKNLVSDFLKDTYYKQNHFINTKGKNDLVIHNGNTANTTVGVIIETKKPTNKKEMVSKDNINAKAFQELVLYYLRERITIKNTNVKHLIITNIYEWFIFDVILFDRLFAQNKDFVQYFTDFEAKRKADITTDFFYKQIAEPFIAALETEIEFTYFNIKDYEKPLRNNDKADDNQLIALFKLLSPEHLLKLSFANDSNSLDKRFYSELLHIIGLTETKDGGKKIIDRNADGARNSGSILEAAIIQLDSLDKINRLEKPSQYGSSNQERLFNVALELSIIWINRILFLKLLEAQLITYHKGNKDFTFLSLKNISNYDDLNSLFFQVLAKKYNERNEDVKKLFEKVPYLNSSLFEPTELEQLTLFISNLKDDKTIPIISSSVLKDSQGKKLTGSLTTLNYLFAFLDAYDFSSEGSEEIQEDNKTLINASVLGLIFEKINGYKDGSFFTPGFITMYMCKETIRKAVVQKFNETKQWNCQTLEDLYDKIEDRQEANQIVNSVKICDPAVGSGHFLVSALNEMIAVKSDLKILLDRNHKRLKEYDVEVVNDELTISDEEGEPFEYNPLNKESQRIQETLFHEKQTIIENCLFGVDINPNSVKICRLRLWIELLKNAYYKSATELETLPNIDINIKCGNSLVSRFAINSDLKKALKNSKWTISSYRSAVDTYRNAESKEQKREMERLIADIKNDFRANIDDPFRGKVSKARGMVDNLATEINTQKQWGDKANKNLIKQFEKAAIKLNELEKEKDEIASNKIYENAFEWRFEFPEVLNNKGDFIGFDVVIGNPPYFSISNEPALKQVSEKYQTFSITGDIYSLFIELSINILSKNSFSTLIVSNKWMRANYGQLLRKYIVENTNPIELIDFGQNLLFESAIVHTNILSMQNNNNANMLKGTRFPDGFFNNSENNFVKYIETNSLSKLFVDENIWNVIDLNLFEIKNKAQQIGKPLKDWNIKINFGIKTGLNEAFIINKELKDKIVKEGFENSKFIKPILRGRDTRKYFAEFKNLWLINIPKGYSIKTNNGETNIVMEPSPRYGNMEHNDAWDSFKHNHFAIAEHLLKYKLKAEKREDQGDFWWELRACAYLKEFEKPKIIFSEIVSEPQFYYDEQKYYPEATVFFISGENLKYLTALLNSKAVTFLFKTFYMGGELVGKIRYKKSFLENVPIPVPSLMQENEITALVNEIIDNKEKNKQILKLEKQIDQLVYKLYELTEDEIRIVEESVK